MDDTLPPRLLPPIDEAHFVLLAGPYHRYELNLLEKAKAQLGTIPSAISRNKYGLWLWRSRDGYLENLY